MALKGEEVGMVKPFSGYLESNPINCFLEISPCLAQNMDSVILLKHISIMKSGS